MWPHCMAFNIQGDGLEAESQDSRSRAKAMGWPGLTSKTVKRKIEIPTINTAQADY